MYEADSATDEEIVLTVLCLLEDSHTTRTYLQMTWSNEKLGNLDLVTASLTTDTAFDLVRRAGADLCRAIPIIRRDLQNKPCILSSLLCGL